MKAIFVAAILAVGALVAYALPTQVFADESETNTEQALKQKNVGSGESTNFNCGENTIDGGEDANSLVRLPPIDVQLCGTAEVDLGRGMQ
jgi:hypothetical protein